MEYKNECNTDWLRTLRSYVSVRVDVTSCVWCHLSIAVREKLLMKFDQEAKK